METSQAFFSIASLFAVNAVLWKLGEAIEKVASEQSRISTSLWLRNLDLSSGPLRTWPSTFVSIFDKVFGSKHLSLKCYLRSIVATLLVATLSLLIFGFILRGGVIPWSELVETKALIAIMVFANINGDYLSLLETRYLLTWMQKSTKPHRRFLMVLLDFVLTSIIFGIIMIPTVFLIEYVHENIVPLDLETRGLGVVGDDVLLLLYISTFAASIWIWFYWVSGTIIKGVVLANPFFMRTKKFLDLDRQPFLSIAVISMIISTACIGVGILLSI